MSFYPVKTKTISPKKAMLYSAILPAGGQFYTHNYIKGIVLGGLEIFLGSTAYKNYRNSLKYKTFSANWYFYRQESMSYALYFLGVYLFTITDAYVSANLFNVKYYFKSRNKNEKNR